MYRVIKSYGHDLGLSACFRQHKAGTHCQFIHGYALAFAFTFEADKLDERGWVIDFGNLDSLKDSLRNTFDHKLLVADDDPKVAELLALDQLGLARVEVMSRVGCEAFAQLAFNMAREVLRLKHLDARVHVVSCRVSEHGANSAEYFGPGVVHV